MLFLNVYNLQLTFISIIFENFKLFFIPYCLSVTLYFSIVCHQHLSCIPHCIPLSKMTNSLSSHIGISTVYNSPLCHSHWSVISYCLPSSCKLVFLIYPGKSKTMWVSRVNQDFKELRPKLYLSSQALQTTTYDKVQWRHMTKSKNVVLTNDVMHNWLLLLPIVCHFPLSIISNCFHPHWLSFPLYVILSWLPFP